MNRPDRRRVSLADRPEIQRRRLLLHRAVLRILDEPDDLDVELPVRAVDAGADVPAHGPASQVELLGERLVDDRDFRGVRPVGARELASGDQRDAERAEEPG